ncbi:3-methylcrotonyl-CoA carboxylase alpha subunit [Burkholderiales bacterium]|nr:MAG: acetyl/propionyl/methylcrotonyl-CoA carboxylase subunit alpha [Burkholderiales bacterium]CAG0995033.1 3-methylcrotonyl-CoA carboxylase alpha subunit [Burkholderiales bacterium]
MFDKILIANRGEIAVRVARTARRMGLQTVAVYSEADRGALHVQTCDEAYLLGPAAPRESYLRFERIIDIAKRSGAQAIHPGYGFLSENENFALACAAAGIVFIGPPPTAIRAMGSKSESKRLMAAASVPLVPGYHGEDQDETLLQAEAETIGYPVLIKASAGGGGKGMRVVERRADFAAALASARREAKSSFADDRVLIEKYLSEPRHIEIQVFADTLGNAVHLFERDCSVQRRHQKVFEEAPAPGMSPERRAQMGSAAVAAAQAIGYVGAGTVEFIAEQSGTFYFMEMNTRLQVEHPVTEMITGLDLVEWQLRVAAGERLPLLQEGLQLRGHAMEARIYAEDPDKNFLPSIGHIDHLRTPATSAVLRIDTGAREGDDISAYYDPMIAKLIVHGEDRAQALRRMAGALAQYQVVGVSTNIEFLHRLVTHPAFAAAKLDTGFIARHQEALLPRDKQPGPDILAALVLAEIHAAHRATQAAAASSTEPNSPWFDADGWWLNSDNHRDFHFEYRGETLALTVHFKSAGYFIDLPQASIFATVAAQDESLRINLGGEEFCCSCVVRGEERIVYRGGRSWRFRHLDALAHAGEAAGGGGHLTAPMSGTVISVLVKAGEAVAAGQALLVMEAMKMEHTIVAPAAGKVVRVAFSGGEQVKDGAELIELAVGE